MERDMIAQKTLLTLIVIAVLFTILFIFPSALELGEKKECYDWQHHPELWVEWRVEQCKAVGVPLPVSP